MNDAIDSVKALVIGGIVILLAVVFCGSCLYIKIFEFPAMSQKRHDYDKAVAAAKAPAAGTYPVNTSMGFNAPTVTTIVVTTSAATFNLVEPTAQGQQQVGQCGGDVSGDYKFTVNLGDGTSLVPTDTFCKSKSDGTKVPFDSKQQAYIDHATFKLQDTFGFPFTFQYRGWRLTVDFSTLSRQR